MLMKRSIYFDRRSIKFYVYQSSINMFSEFNSDDNLSKEREIYLSFKFHGFAIFSFHSCTQQLCTISRVYQFCKNRIVLGNILEISRTKHPPTVMIKLCFDFVSNFEGGHVSFPNGTRSSLAKMKKRR